MAVMKLPFEVPFEDLWSSLDPYVDAVFGTLESDFLVMPRGTGFVEYEDFEGAYEQLKSTTGGFTLLRTDDLTALAFSRPLTLVVLRTVMGITASEWSHLASKGGAGLHFPELCPQH